jgi:hypothetical protein
MRKGAEISPVKILLKALKAPLSLETVFVVM